MASLLDAIRGNLSSVPVPGATDQTASLQDLLRAKGGKLVTPGASPRASNLGEQSANAQAATQAAQLQQTAEIEGQKLATKQEAGDASHTLDMQGTDLARKAQKQQFANETSKLVQELSHAEKTIDMQRDSAKLEQLGFVSRLSNDLYVQELDQAATEKRLQDELGFREATMKAVFGDELDLLRTKLNYGDILSADKLKFEELVAGMDINFAIQVATSQSAAANSQMQAQAVGSAVSSGAETYAKYGGDKKTE